MLAAMSLVLCNTVSTYWGVVSVVSPAYYGDGEGSFGRTVVADISSQKHEGLSAALFYTFGNSVRVTIPDCERLHHS
jgi:hypothetical protein